MGSKIETIITVHVQPNASRNKIVSFKDCILRVKITAPPVDGKANRELVDFLSRLIGLRKSDIRINRGENSRNKVVTISGIERDRLMRMFADLLTDNN